MNICINISVLEKTAINKLRDVDVPENIRKHLGSCTFCNEQYQDLLTQFKLADQQFESFPETMITAFGQSLESTPQNEFVLIAETFTTQIPYQWEPNQILTRAADTTIASKKHHYENRGVLSTKNGELLIRLMRITNTKTTQLHIIAEEANKYQNVPVLIEPLGLEFVSDESGRITLGDIELPDLKELKVMVHTPRAVFNLEEMKQEWKEFIGKGEIQLKNAEDNHIYVEFSPEGQKYRLTVRLEKSQIADGSQKIQIIASKESYCSNVKSVKKGVAVFHEISETPALRVKVFG